MNCGKNIVNQERVSDCLGLHLQSSRDADSCADLLGEWGGGGGGSDWARLQQKW